MYLLLRIVSNQNNEAIRRFMLEKLPIKSFVDSGMPFEDASVETSIEISRKNIKSPFVSVHEYSKNNYEVQFKHTTEMCLFEELPWMALPLNVSREKLLIANKISASKRLFGSEVYITRGFECGKNDSAISNIYSKGSLKFVSGDNVKKYDIGWSGMWANPDWSNKIKYKTKELFASTPKMLVRFVSNDLVGAIDLVGYANTNVLYNIHTKYNEEHLWFVIAAFNSAPIGLWFRTVFMNDDKLFPHIQKNQLEAIPLPICTKNEEKQLGNWARQATELRGNGESGKVQKQIDDLVCKLYKFTKTEIAIINEIFNNVNLQQTKRPMQKAERITRRAKAA